MAYTKAIGTGPSFNDDFSLDALGAPAAGWTPASGSWSVCANGAAHGYCQTSTSGVVVSLAGSPSWTDYTVDVAATVPSVTTGSAGLLGRAVSAQQYYYLQVCQQQQNGTAPYWYLEKDINGVKTILGMGPLNAPDANPNYRLRLTFLGSSISAFIAFDGGTSYRLLTSVTDTSIPAGQIGLRTKDTPANHFSSVVVSSHSPLVTEAAYPAGGFVDTIGLNLGLESVSATDYPRVRSLIGGLGVKHYRVAAWPMLPKNTYTTQLNDLHSAFGAKFDILSALNTPPASVVSDIGYLPAGAVDAVEGPNEPDAPGYDYDPHFAADVPSYMQSLYTTVRSAPTTATLPIYGPTFTSTTNYAAVGDLSKSVDFGNMHDYFSGYNPGTTGFGANGFPFAPSLFYGSIDFEIADAAQATGSKPVVSTETGYCTVAKHGCNSENSRAKYMMRTYLEHFMHKVPRTYAFEMLAYDTTTVIGTFGLISPTPALAPSPAYNALAGMIKVLDDTNVHAAPSTAALSLDGNISNVAHLTFKKSNGKLAIPIWLEVMSYNLWSNNGVGSDAAVPNQTVNVNVTKANGTAVLWTCDTTTGTWSSRPVPFSNGSIPVNVSDALSILEV